MHPVHAPMEPQTAPEAEPRGEAKPESRPDAGVRIVAHDHRRHDAPISTPVGFSSIPVERMKRLRFLEAVWVEDTVDVKVKGKSVGTGGLKMVQRAFQRAEGSIADDGGATGATDSGEDANNAQQLAFQGCVWRRYRAAACRSE